jgi:hypothetical protein
LESFRLIPLSKSRLGIVLDALIDEVDQLSRGLVSGEQALEDATGSTVDRALEAELHGLRAVRGDVVVVYPGGHDGLVIIKAGHCRRRRSQPCTSIPGTTGPAWT